MQHTETPTLDSDARLERLLARIAIDLSDTALLRDAANGLADAVSVYLTRDDAIPCDCDLGFLCHDCQLRRALAAFEAAAGERR